MVAKTILEQKKSWLEIVGAVDIDRNKVGKDLGSVVGSSECGVLIQNDARQAIKASLPDVILHTTSSYLERTFPELMQLAESGVDIVSSCEELSFPRATNPKIAEELDRVAKKNGVTILG